MKVDVFVIPQHSPDDLMGLKHLIQDQRLDPKTIVAIMGKTEGNGCVNDFTRGFAVAALKGYLQPLIGEASTAQIVFVMSGGTEGVLSPHLTIFTRQIQELKDPTHLGLALGIYHTRDFAADEIGRLTMVDTVSAGVKAAITSSGLASSHVHFVQVKCPLIATSAHVNGQRAITQDSYKSMAFSRGAAALGVAVALGEVDRTQLTEEDIGTNLNLYSSVASTSAGSELQNCEILVLGNSPASHSDFLIGHSVMAHSLDVAAVQTAIINAQADLSLNTIVNVFAKAEAPPSGQILGCRNTMLDDSDISHTRMARAVVGSVIASVIQNPMIYVSGGSEHQGPPGGGPIAVISKYPQVRSV